MEQIPFIDVNCMIGRRAFREPGSIYKTEDFLREMDYHHIAGALVHHAFSVELDQPYGNNALMGECAKSEKRLFPCWVILPHHVGEMPPPEQLVAEMLRQNVRAARIYRPWNEPGSRSSSRPRRRISQPSARSARRTRCCR